MHPALRKLGADWNSNQRLRLAVMIVIAVLSANVFMAMQRRAAASEAAYLKDLKLSASMKAMSDDPVWVARAQQAQQQLDDLQQGLPEVGSAGLAQAEMQAWLTKLLKDAGLSEAQVKVEDVLEVPGQPGLLQVMGRVDARIVPFGHEVLMQALTGALPWIQVERIEIAEGSHIRLSLVVRGYYRKSAVTRVEVTDSEGSIAKGGAQ